MALTQIDVNALQVGISVIPMLVDFIKGLHAQVNPTAPPLDDAGALAILLSVANASIAKDDAWKAAHPNG